MIPPFKLKLSVAATLIRWKDQQLAFLALTVNGVFVFEEIGKQKSHQRIELVKKQKNKKTTTM